MKQAFEKYADALLFHPLLYARALLKWLILAAFVGILCGLLGTAFHLGVSWMTQLRQYNVWLILCLPLAGLVVVGCYKLTKSEGLDTNDIIDEVHHGKGLSLCLIPAIFTGTMFTHLCGGSAGREGAALQMGGTIGYHAGKLFHLDDKDLRTATITGMAAFFAALFGTPLAATMFAIMVISVGVFYHVSFIPCFTASLVAYGISVLLGVSPTRFLVQIPPLDTFMLIRVAALAVLCAFVSILFCRSLHTAQKQMKRFLPNPWIRVLIGSLLLITLPYCAAARIITESVWIESQPPLSWEKPNLSLFSLSFCLPPSRWLQVLKGEKSFRPFS